MPRTQCRRRSCAVWRFRDALPEGDGVQPWLYRVLVNTCYSQLRREVPRRDRAAGDAAFETMATAGPSPEALATSSSTAAVVMDALDDLPDHLRVRRRAPVLDGPEREGDRRGDPPPTRHREVPPPRRPPPAGRRSPHQGARARWGSPMPMPMPMPTSMPRTGRWPDDRPPRRGRAPPAPHRGRRRGARARPRRRGPAGRAADPDPGGRGCCRAAIAPTVDPVAVPSRCASGSRRA